MKQILTLIFALFTLTAFSQQMTIEEWEGQSRTNIRLLPKYGHQQKTAGQKQSDADFIEAIMQQEQFKGDRTAASNHMIKLGFSYLYRGDLLTAMYRFNQAYLLDTANTEIYWGFGAVYMTLGDLEKAKVQYEEGLSENPKNTHLLTDYGTYFMAQYNVLNGIDEQAAQPKLDMAIYYLTQSYHLDMKDMNTTFKLSICSWQKGDCEEAWKYYDECLALGGQPITEGYTKELENRCKRKN